MNEHSMRGLIYAGINLLSLHPDVAARRVISFVGMKGADVLERMKLAIGGNEVSTRDLERSLSVPMVDFLSECRRGPNCVVLGCGTPGHTHALEMHARLAPSVIESADKICDHVFDLLGSDEMNLGAEIPWHDDFTRGYRWAPRKFFRDVEIPVGIADIKIPWELSRFQHLAVLGQAYHYTADEKYAREFEAQISDWIRRNPVMRGPNWACTMDVAIRAANWLVGWEFFKTSSSFGEDFLSDFFRSLLSHGRFIRNHLENYGGTTSNHYLSDVAGLFVVAALVPELRESREWLNFAKEELEKEVRKQVYEDGCDFEASTCYHRFVLELLFFPALIGQRAGIHFSDEYNARLRKMFGVLRGIMKPDGRIPQIGDNDNGRFMRFEAPDTDILDASYLLPLAAVYFNDGGFAFLPSREGSGPDEAFLAPLYWLYGNEGVQRRRAHAVPQASAPESRGYCNGGWYIMRNHEDYLAISCGTNGQNGNGGHAHNDKLSFELNIDGRDIVVDPGTFVYTPDPERRNRFRSVANHNTIMVDEREQNPFVEGLLFVLPDCARASCSEWSENDKEIRFTGMHEGYSRLPGRIMHERTIVCRKQRRQFSISDRMLGTGSISLKLFLHFAPGITPQRNASNELRLIGAPVPVRIAMVGGLSFSLEEYEYSASYGSVEKAVRAVCLLEVRLPWETVLNVSIAV